MTPELAYFLKINIAIALFYAFYRLFFYKDTFFQWRRTVLLCFFVISPLYPVLNIQEWIRSHEPMVAMADLYATIVLPEIEITPEVATTDWQNIILSTVNIIYWAGVVLLLIRFVAQFASILRLRFHCQKDQIEGIPVYLLDKESGPFSFFHWIFIHPQAHPHNELSEILTHEGTHARQKHSIDVIISELMCIACWFNPFAWLMKREVRNNLEYMADNRVLEAGHDSKSYQYHLLGLAHQKSTITISNSFNVLPLKNRITMMNKKRTKEIGRTKYLLFLPLALALMIVSNIEAVARTTKNIAKEMMQTVEEQIEQKVPAEENTPSHTADAPQPQTDNTAGQTTSQKPKEQTVFEVVEQMPEFPGGVTEMKRFISSHLRYPAIAQENGIHGQVVTQFIIRADGTITDCTVAKSVHPILDAEALRVIKEMPKWRPGRQRGIAVATRMTVPVRFHLIDEAPDPASTSDKNLENKIFDVVEQATEFPGGMKACLAYMYKNIKYPTAAQEAGIQGQVVIQMIVDKDGHIRDPKIVRGVSPELNAEALRIVSGMPKWIPGKQKGKNVATRFTLPIRFRLT